MNDSRVSLLTPSGSGAIAVLALRGPRAWPVAHELFRPAGARPLPDEAPAAGLWFGRIGESTADEVVLSSHGPDRIEIHCHGGRRAVAWLIDLLRARGITEEPPPGGVVFADPAAGALLPFARTARAAAVLVDQAHGAYLRAAEQIEAGGSGGARLAATLRRNARAGRHLIEPWRVVIAGPPNAGKSSLLNTLAGFARSVVSPVPGTTRDAVSVSLAFDGWPVDVFDTAGLRETPDALEREGVDRALSAAAGGDLVLWVVDATRPPSDSLSAIAETLGVPPAQVLIVSNKVDLASLSEARAPGSLPVSALTGRGVADLVARVAAVLVPEPPGPGDPVPYAPELCDRWS